MRMAALLLLYASRILTSVTSTSTPTTSPTTPPTGTATTASHTYFHVALLMDDTATSDRRATSILRHVERLNRHLSAGDSVRLRVISLAANFTSYEALCDLVRRNAVGALVSVSSSSYVIGQLAVTSTYLRLPFYAFDSVSPLRGAVLP